MEDDLTWLARNAHQWPVGDTLIGRILKDGEFAVVSVAATPVAFINWFTLDQWLARRAELQNKPSWKDAPEWACYLGQSDEGVWHWFDGEPEISEVHDSGEFWNAPGYTTITDRHGAVLGDWRDTLERRPVDLSEPAGGVKERGADGAEELNAMAQRLLVALKSDPRSFDTGALAEMVELADAEIVKRDAAVCGGEGCLNNHWFERGELPPVGTRCEALITSESQWVEIEVICHRDGFALGWCLKERCGYHGDEPTDFRPLRTERDLAVEEMKQHCQYHGSWDAVGRIYAEALYDAGYRKQISPAK